jgi:hypothetical protein
MIEKPIPLIGNSKSNFLLSNVMPYQMSRFNVRLCGSAAAPPPSIITDKKPSAYSAMKYGTSAPPVSEFVSEEASKSKGGRPSKDDLRKRKLAMASGQISTLVLSNPTRAKIREYMESRIAQLDEEKR